MKRQTMAQATFIMMVAGFIIKILGIIYRIIITRALGDDGMMIYALIHPTMMLLVTLATVGLPVAIPAIISRGDMKERKVLTTSLTISMTISTIITFAMFFLAQPIATYLLKNPGVVLPLMVIGPLLCAISYTSILKSYFQGKENMTPGAVSTMVEQVVRMGLSIVLIAWLLPRGIPYGVAGLILASIGGELSSAIILTFWFVKFKKDTYPHSKRAAGRFEPLVLKGILGISLPTTGSRLIGSITNFFEPIIVMAILMHHGFASNTSGNMFSAVTMFAIPLLLMPSFVSSSVTQSLIPAVSKAYKTRDLATIHKRMSTAFRISFFTCGFYLILVMIFPYEIMHLLYNKYTGAEFLKIMAPIFLIAYVQAPLVATLQAIGEAKFALHASIVAAFVKIGLMSALMMIPELNILGLVYSILINIILLTVWYYVIVRQKIGYKLKYTKIINGGLVLSVVYIIGQHLKTMPNFGEGIYQIVFVSLALFAIHSILSLIGGLSPK